MYNVQQFSFKNPNLKFSRLARLFKTSVKVSLSVKHNHLLEAIVQAPVWEISLTWPALCPFFHNLLKQKCKYLTDSMIRVMYCLLIQYYLGVYNQMSAYFFHAFKNHFPHLSLMLTTSDDTVLPASKFNKAVHMYCTNSLL